MTRSFAILLAAISGAALILPLLAFGHAKDSEELPADATSAAASERGRLKAAATQADASHSGNAQSGAAQRFRGFLDADWRRWMEEYPEETTVIGYPRHDDHWIDDPPAGIAGRKNHL